MVHGHTDYAQFTANQNTVCRIRDANTAQLQQCKYICSSRGMITRNTKWCTNSAFIRHFQLVTISQALSKNAHLIK